MSHNRSSEKSVAKIRHLKEHLPYELLMLRYTHKQLTEQNHKLNFNCYLECFGIHARLLLAFLTNQKGNGNNNFIASDFAKYRPISHDELRGVTQRVNSQILHLGKKRPSQPEEKFNTADADNILKWIETAILRFLDALSPEYRSHWNEDGADPVKFIPAERIGVGPTNVTSLPFTVTGPSAPPTKV